MKHLFKMSLRYLREQKLRTFLTWCCITVAAVMLCTFCMAGSSLYATLKNYFIATYGSNEATVPIHVTDYQTSAPCDLNADVLCNSALVEEAACLSASEPIYRIIKSDGICYDKAPEFTINGIPQDIRCEIVTFSQTFWELDPTCYGYFELDGRMPAQAGEIVLPNHCGNADPATGFAGCAIGDTISVTFTPRTFVTPADCSDTAAYLAEHPELTPVEQGPVCTGTYTVVGFQMCEDSVMVHADDTQLREVLQPWTVSLRIKRGLDYDSALEQLLADAGATDPAATIAIDVKQNGTLLLLELRGAQAIASLWSYLAGFSLVAVIILLLARLIIDNAFEMSTQERVRQFGILRTIGASRGQVSAIVAFEALFYALTTIPVALLLTRISGMAAARSLSDIAPKIGTDFSNLGMVNDTDAMLHVVEYKFYLPFVLCSVLLCCAAIFISSYTSARKATRVSPIEALSFGRPSAAADSRIPQAKAHKKARARHLLGFVPFYTRKNRLRNKKRYRVTAFSAALGIFLFVFCTSAILSAKDVMSYLSDGYMSISTMYFNYPATCTPADAERELQVMRDTGFFEDCTPQNYLWADDTDTLSDRAYAEFYTPAFEKLIGQSAIAPPHNLIIPVDRFTYADDFQAQTGMDYDAWAASGNGLLAQYTMLEEENFSSKMHQVKAFGDDIAFTLPLSDDKAPLTVRGSIDNRELPGAMRGLWKNAICVYVPLERLWSTQEEAVLLHSFGLVLVPNDASYENAIAWLDDYGETVQRQTGLQFSYEDTYGEQRTSAAMVNTLSRILLYLIGLVLIINLFNIMNTVHTSVLNRRRELAMLRAVGMSHGQLCRSVLLDAAQYMITATAVSGLLAALTLRFLLPALGIYLADWLVYVLLATLIAAAFSLLFTLLATLPSLLKLKHTAIMSVIREIE